jgi:RNA polymerase sigma-70 factor (ECF subfamily)
MSDEATLLGLLESHSDALHRIAWAYAGGDGEEEDLFQEILTQAWRSLPSFRGDAASGTWLYRVALNTALTWRRRAAKRSSGAIPFQPSHNGSEPSSVPSPRSEAAILEDFIGTLGGPNRSVLILYMEGLSYQEIAAVTGLSESAVGVRIHRMKQAFTDRYVER